MFLLKQSEHAGRRRGVYELQEDTDWSAAKLAKVTPSQFLTRLDETGWAYRGSDFSLGCLNLRTDLMGATTASWFLKSNAYHELEQELGGAWYRESLPGGGTAWLFYHKLEIPAEGQCTSHWHECRARLTRMVNNQTTARKSKPPYLRFQAAYCLRSLLCTLSAGIVMLTASA